MGGSHAVTGNNDDFFRIFHNKSSVFGAAAAAVRSSWSAVASREEALSVAAGHDLKQRGVHCLGHDISQNGAAGTDNRAGNDQQRLSEREADSGRRPAGIELSTEIIIGISAPLPAKPTGIQAAGQ